MKTLKYIIAALAGIVLVSGCATYYYEHANNNFDKFHYNKAIVQYKKSLSKKIYIPDAQVQLAHAYRLTNNFQLAEDEYAQLVTAPDCDPVNQFYYAKMLMINGKYPEARVWLSRYLNTFPNDSLANSMLASCNDLSSFMVDTTLYTLTFQPFAGMNSSFNAVNFKEGIVFAGENKEGGRKNPWNGQHYLDLFYTQKDYEGQWISPITLKGEINGIYHEGPATFNQSHDIVYFTKSNYLTQRRLDKNEANINNLKIFKASLIDNKWQQLEELAFNSDDYSCGHPALSEDGKTLYFVSDMPGGYGGTDVYMTKIQEDGQWSAPKNLGQTINTPGNEMFPYMHGNDTLYFASEGHNSMGGLDVLMTWHNSDTWHEPVNLNYPLNSSADDFGYFLNGGNHRTGYVSSNRAGTDAVYSFRINDPTLILKGVVTVKGTGAPIKNALVILSIPDDTASIRILTDDKGYYSTPLSLEKSYKLMASKENFLSQSAALSTIGQKISKEYIQNFQLEAIVLQKPIVIPNIYYDFDKWVIRPDAAIELDKIVTLLKDNPNIRIEMGSHADCRGTFKYNERLTEKRARAAVQYLVDKGIDAKRLEYKGYGETQPVNDCGCEPDQVGPGKDCTREQHQQNRRTEFKVIEIIH